MNIDPKKLSKMSYAEIRQETYREGAGHKRCLRCTSYNPKTIRCHVGSRLGTSVSPFDMCTLYEDKFG